MKKYPILFLILSLCIGSLKAQDAQFSQYMFNNVYNNPAYAGVEGYTKLSLFHRSQWVGYGASGNPVTQLATITSPLMRYNAGFSAFVMNDKIGAQTITQIQAKKSTRGAFMRTLDLPFRRQSTSKMVN